MSMGGYFSGKKTWFHSHSTFVLNVFWSLIGEGASKGLMFVSLVLVARLLGTEQYGEFGMIRTTVNMFVVFGGLGLGLTANKYVAECRDSDKKTSGEVVGGSYVLAIVSGGVVAGTLFFGAPMVANEFFKIPSLADGLRISALLLFFSAINGAQIGILQGLGVYRYLAIGCFVQGIATLMLFVLGARWFGLNGLLVGFVLQSILTCAVFNYFVSMEMKKQSIRTLYRGAKNILPIFIKFSIPATLTGVAIAPFKWIVEAVAVKNNGFSDLATFYAGMTIVTAIISVVSTVNSPLISMAAGGRKAADAGLKLNLYGSWYLFMPFALPVVMFPDFFLGLFGAGYNSDSARVVLILLLVYCGSLLYYQGVVRVLVVGNSMWSALFTNVVEGLALVGIYYLYSRYDSIGLAVSYVGSYVARIAITVPVVLKRGLIPAAIFLDCKFLMTFVAFVVFAGVVVGRNL